MSRQPSQRSVLHKLFSALTRKAPQQAKQPIQAPQRPAPGDSDAWHAYWKAQGQTWRMEPEIDVERQKELEARRAITPDIEKGIYPFRGMKLSRADIEWLLATHENGQGPIDWSDESQRRRDGLDLRGADLRRVDLQNLPLSRMRGGLTMREWDRATAEQREMAAIHLEGAHLWDAFLDEAFLRSAHLEGADLRWIRLVVAELGEAHLEGVNLRHGRLKGAFLQHAHLEGADLRGAHLEGVKLKHAYLEGKCTPPNILEYMQQENGNFPSMLSPANLQHAFFDSGTDLEFAKLGNKEHGFVPLADVHWSDANLALVKWSFLDILGDEQQARQKTQQGQKKDAATHLDGYETAVRANRQLAVALQSQGLNEQATRFAYRAQTLQKTAFRLQILQSSISFKQRMQSLGAWLFSWFLFLIAGYGYKVWRSFLAYLLIIGTFMVLYLFLDPHLAWYEALVVSMTAFHGRGFSPSTFSPGDPLSIASAVEAFVGLIIEVTFIATLTRRFFGQ